MSTKHIKTLEELTPYGQHAYKMFKELCAKWPNAKFKFTHFITDTPKGTQEEWCNIYSDLEDADSIDYERSTHVFFNPVMRSEFINDVVTRVYAYFGNLDDDIKRAKYDCEIILATQNI
ncbi:hypothetical protein MA9V1_090 [Chryseobacterium phage MA9V-1]|nr:hypothetical protein MA9V1_090 [Chryseobacterium phage MA9V-1]